MGRARSPRDFDTFARAISARLGVFFLREPAPPFCVRLIFIQDIGCLPEKAKLVTTIQTSIPYSIEIYIPDQRSSTRELLV
jgi:hypothetical protein